MSGSTNDTNALLLAIESIESNSTNSSEKEVYDKLNQAFDPTIGIGKKAIDKEGRTPLIIAVINNNFHVVKWLLDSNAHPKHYSPDVNQPDNNGLTALMYAVRFKTSSPEEIMPEHKVQNEIMNLLLNNKNNRADPWIFIKDKEKHAVAEAAAYGNLHFLYYFFNDVWKKAWRWNIYNLPYYLILENAASQNQTLTINFLLTHSAWSNFANSSDRWRTRFYSIISHVISIYNDSKIETNQAEALISLLRQFSFTVERDEYYRAIAWGNIDLYQWLEKNYGGIPTYGSPRDYDKYGAYSPIAYAINSRQKIVAEYLIKNKNIIAIEEEYSHYRWGFDRSGLNYAIKQDDLDSLKLLIENKIYNDQYIFESVQKSINHKRNSCTIYLETYEAICTTNIDKLFKIKDQFNNLNYQDKLHLFERFNPKTIAIIEPVLGKLSQPSNLTIPPQTAQIEVIIEKDIPNTSAPLLDEKKEEININDAEKREEKVFSPNSNQHKQLEGTENNTDEEKKPDPVLKGSNDGIVITDVKNISPKSEVNTPNQDLSENLPRTPIQPRTPNPFIEIKIPDSFTINEINSISSANKTTNTIESPTRNINEPKSKYTTPGTSPIHTLGIFQNTQNNMNGKKESFIETCSRFLSLASNNSLDPSACKLARDNLLLAMIAYATKDEKTQFQVVAVLSQAFDQILEQNNMVLSPMAKRI